MEFSVTISGLNALVAKLKESPTIAAPILQRALSASGAVLAKNTTKATVPWRTGFLTQTFKAELTTGMLRWFPTASYACVFDANTRVLTEDGVKEISTIRTGDKVLTQDGKYHIVTAASKFPATEKPDLIDIAVEYRKGSAHKLTLTLDHKVLVYREGRNKWVQAGELLPTDQLFTRIKTAHNKGTGRTHVCKNCQREHSGQGESFCSASCRNEFWRTNGNPHTGSRRSELSKEKMSAAAKRRFANDPASHPNKKMAMAGHKTQIEQQTEEWLHGLGVSFEYQKLIGKHWIDFYVPEWDTAFECDGGFWHKDQNRDVERDKEILAEMPGLRIVHIHYFDKRHSPLLVPKPFRHVSYVAVNPNINSYVDLEQFRPRKIVSLRRWTYEQSGSRVASLYDISVEGMHSFVANSVIVSNSYVEFGTKPHMIYPKDKQALYWPGAAHPVKSVSHPGTKPNDFMGRIVEASQNEINEQFASALEKITATIAAA